MDRPNLGLTVNGKPLDDGAGLWVPGYMFPGATVRDARVTERWLQPGERRANSPVTTSKARLRKNGRFAKQLDPPTRDEMLARLRAGKG